MAGSLWGNISAVLYFIYFQLAGLAAAHILLKEESRPVRLAVGSAAGSLMLHLLPSLGAIALDFTVAGHIAAALLLRPVFVIYIKRGEKVKFQPSAAFASVRKNSRFVLFAAVLFVLWCCLLDSHIIPPGADGAIHTGQCTYGDMNMHLGFISSIARQGSFPPEYSIFPGTKLAYPFLNAAISSSLYLLGASLRLAYILPMLAAFVQIVAMVYILAVTVLNHRAKALFSLVLFMLNGGLGFVYFTGLVEGCDFKFSDIFTGFYTTPTNLVDHNIRWANVIADILLPQRASLFGYAMVFCGLWLLYRAVWQDKKQYFVYAAVFAGALPLIHTHSFLAMGLVSAGWLLLYLYRDDAQQEKWYGGVLFTAFVAFMCALWVLDRQGLGRPQLYFAIGISGIELCVLYGIYLLTKYIRKNGYAGILSGWGVYLAIVLVMAVPQLVLWTFGQVAEGGFLRGHFNWGNLKDFYPWFYIKNIGAPLVLIVGAVFRKNGKGAELILPAGVIWFVAELIMFTPNTYDNNKLLYVAYMLLCIAAADFGLDLYEKYRKNILFTAFSVVFVAVCTVSGLLTIGREYVSDYWLYRPDHVAAAEYILAQTDADDVFLTNTRHNNEVPSLTGRSIVCGADTFLYFHGIDTSARKAEVKQMFENPAENIRLYEKYSVDYIMVSSWERADYYIDLPLYEQLFERVFEKGNVIIYKVN
ncbi:MAG: hypothetical protein II977_00100 [Oscillospiraceae bacterium]|nr:hypothetical protein [Oscillospiraceae bacterium]